MGRSALLLTATVFLTVLLWHDVMASAPPFTVGEKLTFQIKWSFIPAGEAVLEVLPVTMVDGIAANHFVMTAKTYPVVDLLFKTRDRIDSFTDLGLSHALLYRKKQEGKYKRDEIVTLDWQKGEARYSNFGELLPPIPLLEGTFDPLSAFYYVRQEDFAKKSELLRPVTDGKKSVIGRTRVIRREKIEVAGKSYDTYLLEPELKHLKGVFEKSKNARMLIWVTADERRLPVRFTSKVIVGSFVAELISIN